jgi:hypothetical protein
MSAENRDDADSFGPEPFPPTHPLGPILFGSIPFASIPQKNRATATHLEDKGFLEERIFDKGFAKGESSREDL